MTILIDFNSHYEHFAVEKETEKAWMIKGQWFPKSAFSKDVNEWINSIDRVTIMQNASYRIQPWFYKRMNHFQAKALGLIAGSIESAPPRPKKKERDIAAEILEYGSYEEWKAHQEY